MAALAACSSFSCTSRRTDNTLTVILYSAPITLHPRNAVDEVGQQLDMLIFRGLTRIDPELEVKPDLAESWQLLDQGKTYRFRIKQGLADHTGAPITPKSLARCLENYRGGKLPSRHVSSFPSWKTTEASGDDVILRLSAPDPYLPRNLSILRYYVGAGDAEPCLETKPEQPLIGSGMLKPDHWDASPEREVKLLPAEHGVQPLRFVFVADDTARTVKMLRGEVDAIFNAFSLPRTRWIANELSDRFRVLERASTKISYLMFNLRDPILARKEVRQAIALSIDRESWVKYKMFGFGQVATSFLYPELPESSPIRFAYDPARAERLLDQAGFARGKDGIRFPLHFRCTSFREGTEQALGFQDNLRKIGIDLRIDVVEPAVWAESVKRGAYQLSASRFTGVSDGSIFYSMLHTGKNLNRAGYTNPEMDALLDRTMTEPDFAKRKELLHKIQLQIADEMPYFPLWYWANGLILRKDLGGLEARDISLSGALEPLLKLR